jgi:hypothetical protein
MVFSCLLDRTTTAVQRLVTVKRGAYCGLKYHSRAHQDTDALGCCFLKSLLQGSKHHLFLPECKPLPCCIGSHHPILIQLEMVPAQKSGNQLSDEPLCRMCMSQTCKEVKKQIPHTLEFE